MTETASNEYAPSSVSPPGDTIRDLIEEREWTQCELAARMGRPQKTVNEIIRGKTTITRETAQQLAHVFGVSAEFWLTREARYQEWLSRQESEEELSGEQAWVQELPWRHMVKCGWVASEKPGVPRVEAALRFFGVASVAAWREHYAAPLVAFRRSTRVSSSAGAVAAWLRRGEIEAAGLRCEAFDRRAFREALTSARGLAIERDLQGLVRPLVDMCARAGVAVVFVPAPPGCPASGVTRWLAPDKALLQLSLRHRTNDHFWFTFMHEAGHLLLHGKKLRFVEGLDSVNPEHEAEANRFAEDMLIPPSSAARLATLGPSEAGVRRFAEEIGVAPGIVVGRMQKDGLLPRTHLNGLKASYSWDG